MLDSLKWLGKMLAQDEPFLPIKPVPRRKGKKDEYLVKIIFDMDRRKVIADPITLTDEVVKQYRWIGRIQRAAKEPVCRLTIDDVKYIKQKKNNLVINIRQKIRELQESGMISKEIKTLDNYLAKIEKSFLGKKNLDDLIDKVIGDLKGNILLYTICIRERGKLIELAKTKGYDEFLNRLLKSPIKTIEGTCYMCGNKKQVLTDPAFDSGSLPKIYNIDKKGFMAGISSSERERLRTFALCEECRSHILQSWNYVKNNLTTSNIRGVKTYLIPRAASHIPVEDLKKWSNSIKEAYDAVSSYEGLKKFEKRMQEYFTYIRQGEWYSLNIIFGIPESAHFNLISFIQDVPVTRLNMLRERMEKTATLAQSLLGGDQQTWNLGFNEIAEIYPIEAEKERVPRGYKSLIELFDAMLLSSKYSYEQLISKAILLARIHKYESYAGYNIRNPYGSADKAMCIGILKYNILIRMLRDLGVLEAAHEDLSTEHVTKHLPDEINKWFSEMGYPEFARALFLLGYLIGEVGRAQFIKGDKKKSILNKIDFYGMNRERIIELANIILKSLRDYRLLQYNEALYYNMKALLDKHLSELERNPAENVYYILSGYAFSTYRAIVKGESGGGD
ncbi:MAG: type I-B CRISPR-associated protein Cas8b/Csh1 [Nitrososphaerota archaeon]